MIEIKSSRLDCTCPKNVYFDANYKLPLKFFPGALIIWSMWGYSGFRISGKTKFCSFLD